MLSEVEAKRLKLLAFMCAFDVALRDGLEVVPRLEP